MLQVATAIVPVVSLLTCYLWSYSDAETDRIESMEKIPGIAGIRTQAQSNAVISKPLGHGRGAALKLRSVHQSLSQSLMARLRGVFELCKTIVIEALEMFCRSVYTLTSTTHFTNFHLCTHACIPAQHTPMQALHHFLHCSPTLYPEGENIDKAIETVKN